MKKDVTHTIRLDWHLKLIAIALVIGIFANAFNFNFGVRAAIAELNYGDVLNIKHSGSIDVFRY